MKAIHAKAYIDVIGDDGRRIERQWFAPGLTEELKATIRAHVDTRVARHNAGEHECQSNTELTPEGEQYVIPGCEKAATDGSPQGSLW